MGIGSGSDALVLAWHARRVAAGLAAEKPVVLFVQDIVVGPGKAVEVTRAGRPGGCALVTEH